MNDSPKNGNAISVTGTPTEPDNTNLNQLSASLTKLNDSQRKLQTTIRKLHVLQLVTIVLTITIGVLLAYLFHVEFSHNVERGECYRENAGNL